MITLRDSLRLVLAAAVAVSGCDKESSAKPTAPSVASEPRWESLLDPMPEMLLVVRPHALLRDSLYGPLLRRAVDLARQRSQIVSAADLIVIVRGVPADVDPVTLVDEQRRPLWTTAPASALHELIRAPSVQDPDNHSGAPLVASLFELPGRTWVIASGKECVRARWTLSHPTAQAGAKSPMDTRLEDDRDPRAIARLRLTGRALVEHIRALRPPGLLAAVGQELASVTVVLLSAADATLRATFAYNREQAALPAEETLRETLAALSSTKPQAFAWLRTASVRRSRSSVLLTIALPPRLLDMVDAPDGGSG